MVVEISEELACDILRTAKSPAGDSNSYYDARLEAGWRFGWREDAGQPTMGARAWIVTDNRQAASVPINKTAQQVIDELNATVK